MLMLIFLNCPFNSLKFFIPFITKKKNPSQINQYRAIHGAVWLVLGGFFALHQQGWFSPISNRTSPVEEWELVYKRYCAPY